MNKRDKQVKKWMKRFIYPVINGLPTTDCARHVHESHGGYMDGEPYAISIMVGTNHTVINGEVVPEGVRSAYRRRKLLTNMRATGDKVRQIVKDHKYPHFRNLWIERSSIRVRIITE